ncbi:MAG: hypothetical protein VB112_05435 [Oscillospiraceae bacterium]|nr:hypothetical protein [Oscillospiraceae bacterium]
MDGLMHILASNLLGLMVFLLIVFFGVVGIEYHLGAKASALPGLVLPILFFALSIFITFSASASTVMVYSAMRLFGIFLLCNITTAILTVAYVDARRNRGIYVSPVEEKPE